MKHGVNRFLVFVAVILIIGGCQAKFIEEVDKSTTDEVLTDPSVEPIAYIYRHRDTAAGGNDREAYIWEVLGAALESTVEDYGAYKIELVEDINQEREDYEIINNTGVVTIISDSLNQNNIDHLTRVEFPIMRNLLGYRVFIIDKEKKEAFSNIQTVEDLKPFVFGVGIGWNDKWILENAGIKVFEESDYKTLFKDVSTGIFDVFSRGVNEVVGEMETFSEAYPNLMIEENILLYYPLPRYFWFSKSSEGDKLKTRLMVGLKRVHENGTLEKIFNQYFEESIKQLNLKNRKLIKLENPMYLPEYELNDRVFWFDPLE